MKRLSTKAFTTMALLGAFAAPSAYGQFSITVLHNNDGESELFADANGVGGVAEFKTMFDITKSYYESLNHGVVSIYSGDSFLAGPEFQASLDNGTYYDALAISSIGYDASILGNHEFDFGTQVLSDFINAAQTYNSTSYLSANLDFSTDANIASNTNISAYTSVSVNTAAGTKTVGIIGATTENLGFISSPGTVGINNVASAVDQAVLDLQTAGADVIILGSHLQGIAEDQALVSALSTNSQSAIDLIVAGGGDDLLANTGATAVSPTTVYDSTAPLSVIDTGLATGDTSAGAYPDTLAGIPIVATDSNYGYLGRVTLEFDANGDFTGVEESSNPQLNTGYTADAAVSSDVAAVQTYVDGLSTNIVANSSVQLLQGGSDTIRSQETNLGSLVADAQRTAALAKAADFGITLDEARTIGIANGGGIRSSIDAGDVSVLDIFNVSPFGNVVSVIEDLTVADLVLTLENAVSKVVDGAGVGVDPERSGSGTGRFAQVSGLSFTYDIYNDAMVLDDNGNIETAGSRIIDVILDDGTVLVEDGTLVVANADILLDLILPSYNAAGGDQYMDNYLSQSYGFTRLGITDQQALQAYFEGFAGADLATVLNGEYSDVNGSGRISAVPEPTSLVLLSAGTLLMARRRRCRG